MVATLNTFLLNSYKALSSWTIKPGVTVSRAELFEPVFLIEVAHGDTSIPRIGSQNYLVTVFSLIQHPFQ